MTIPMKFRIPEKTLGDYYWAYSDILRDIGINESTYDQRIMAFMALKLLIDNNKLKFNFEYKNLKLNKNSIPYNGEIQATVEVSNTGSRDGEEVIQLYIRDLIGSLTRPIKELKGFQKIMIKAGETKTVQFTINAEMLQFYTVNKKWEVEPGDFNVWIGGDSRTSLKQLFTVSE